MTEHISRLVLRRVCHKCLKFYSSQREECPFCGCLHYWALSPNLKNHCVSLLMNIFLDTKTYKRAKRILKLMKDE